MKLTERQALWLLLAIVVFAVVLYYMAPVVMPFAIGVILAYILNPLIDVMERCKLPRTLSIAAVFLVGLVVLVVLLLLLIPMLEKQFWLLAMHIPDILAWAQKRFHLQIDPAAMKQLLLEHVQASGNVAKHVWLAVLGSGKVLVEFAINLVLIPIVAIYLMRDWERVTAAFRAVLPSLYREKVLQMVNDCGEVLSAFFRGQLLVMIALAIFYAMGLMFAGLEFALVIGIATGILTIVPYLGIAIGFAVALIDAFASYHDWLHLFYVVVVFGIGHVLESYVLQPLLIGNRIGLHPVAVIFAVIAGGVLFGFTGMLLALPIAAVIMVLLRSLYFDCVKVD